MALIAGQTAGLVDVANRARGRGPGAVGHTGAAGELSAVTKVPLNGAHRRADGDMLTPERQR